MRHRNRNKCLSAVAAILMWGILLVGCEANPHESTYQRAQKADNIIDRSDDYSQDEYSSDLFADQPTSADELSRLGITEQGEALTTTLPEIRSSCREQILGFVHAWMQFGYTYSKVSDFDKVSEHMTDDLSQAFSQSLLADQKLNDAILWSVISDIRSVYFYDRYCKVYTTEDGTEIIRIKTEIIVRMTGDEEYFVENQNVNKGDVCYEYYFYFIYTDPMPIYGIYEIASEKKCICWYTSQGIETDDSELIGDEFSYMTGEYKYLKSDVSLPTAEKSKVHRRITDFFRTFFIKGRDGSDILTNGSVESDVIDTYGKLKDAIENGEIEYDQNYISYSMEMAFPNISLYESNGMTYYVAKESLMLNTVDGAAIKYGLGYIETGLWKYSIYFVFDADDRNFRIVRIEIYPDSGPYESAGDLDEG